MRSRRKDKKKQQGQNQQKKQKRVKMNWLAYKVIFRVISPIHIGFEKMGNLQTTRCYVTGRNIWGALTARIARDNQVNGRIDYINTGKKVDETLAFTYFYISDQEGKCINPWDKNGYVTDEFSWKYLGSYMSTSIKERNANEGSLHEVEFISPYTRDGNEVYLTGYIFEKNDGDNQFKEAWKKALNRLIFGGERSYGWGRVEYKGSPTPLTSNDNIDIQLFDKICLNVDLNSDKLRLISKKIDDSQNNHTILLAHTEAQEKFEKIKGYLVQFTGRATKDVTNDNNKKNKINQVENSGIYWTPGSEIEPLKDSEIKFEILEKGLWKPIIVSSSNNS